MNSFVFAEPSASPYPLRDDVSRSGRRNVAEDRHGGGDRRSQRPSTGGGPRRPARNGQNAPRSSGPDRARRTQPRDDQDFERSGPPIPPEIEAKQLAPDVRSE